MNLDYKTTVQSPDKLRTLHVLVIDGDTLSTTRSKEVLQFAKNRSISRHDWKLLKEAVRLGEALTIR